MNNSLDKLNKVFEISDLCYLQEKEKSISKLNEELEREFQSFGVDYGSLKAYFMIIFNTVKHLVNCRISFDIREVNSLIEKDIEKSISTIAFKKIRERIMQTIEEEFQYLIDKVTNFSEDHHFPNKMLEWIKEEIDNEKVEILKDIKKDVEIDQKKFELKIGINDLSEEQKRDYKKYEYKCKDKIYVLGTSQHFRSNDIIINKVKMTIGDSILKLLLRFLVELKKGNGGWISRDVILDENIFNSDDPEHPKGIEDFRIYYELRKALKGYLLKKDSNKFIENDRKKHYRISTHPDFIKCDREKLLNHKDSQIRKLAEELPNNDNK